jgi:hypothetical protein
MASTFSAGNCNENPLDFQCYCFGNGPTEFYKIFDVKTAEYVCCGGMGFLYTNNSPNLLGTNDEVKNTLYNAAKQDDPRCAGWWAGPNNENFSGLTITDPSPLVIPEAGKDWYLPNSTSQINGTIPGSFGPSDSDRDFALQQAKINAVISIPTNSLSGSGTISSCDTSTLTENKVYWLRGINPNNRQIDYYQTLVCADAGKVANSPAATDSNFALFNVNCTQLFTGDNTNNCIVYSGEISNTSASTPSNLVFNSQRYGGNLSPVPEGTEEEHTPWWASTWFWILMVIVVAIIVFIIIFVLYIQNRKQILE